MTALLKILAKKIHRTHVILQSVSASFLHPTYFFNFNKAKYNLIKQKHSLCKNRNNHAKLLARFICKKQQPEQDPHSRIGVKKNRYDER